MSENTFAAGLAPAVQRLPHDSLCTARPNSAQPVPNLPSPSVPQLVVPLPAEIVPQPVGQLARANSAAARGRIPAPPAAQSDSWQEHWGRNTKLPSRHLPAPIFLPASPSFRSENQRFHTRRSIKPDLRRPRRTSGRPSRVGRPGGSGPRPARSAVRWARAVEQQGRRGVSATKRPRRPSRRRLAGHS